MNLRDQLKRILPEILPKNPAEAIKGTELIQLVKYRLNQNYSDATLRYHFSIMSCDPSSPIAKVEQGQGYYLRTTTLQSLESARNLIPAVNQGLFGDVSTSDEVDTALDRANKFRAVFRRFSEANHRFPYSFELSFSGDQPVEKNSWCFPEVATVEWLVGETDDESGIRLDKNSIEVRRRMGGSPFRISSVRLKLETNHATMREDVFQALSASLWANTGELAIAAAITDGQLIDDLRKLADHVGIGVTSFGMTPDSIDDLPEPAAIANMTAREFEAVQGMFKIRRISLPRERGSLDWDLVNQFQSDNEDFAGLFAWVSACLMDEQAYSAEQYLEANES